MSRKTCIILVGPPCSGKSSAGKLAAQLTSARYISSGDIARDMAKYDAQIGNDLSDGKMAPEDRMRKSISEKLWHYFNEENKDTVILDGFPRFGDQAKWLRDTLPKNIDIYYVCFYVSSLSTIIERSAHRGRDDDKSLKQRLKYYSDVTFAELYEYIDCSIDAGENSVEECSKLLIQYIEEVSRYC